MSTWSTKTWKPMPGSGDKWVMTPCFIMQPYQWNVTPSGTVVTAATPKYFPDRIPIGYVGKYNIYTRPKVNPFDLPMRLRSKF